MDLIRPQLNNDWKHSLHYEGGYVQELFSGHHVGKVFNTLPSETLQNPAVNNIGKTVIFLSGDDDLAKTQAAELISLTGFEPVDLGSLESAAHFREIGRPLSGIEFIKVKGSEVAHKR